MSKTKEQQLDEYVAALREQFNFICNDYIELFSEKQNLEFDGWVANDAGGIAGFITQYFFNLHDIIHDIESKAPVGLILHWQDDNLENKPNYINYPSYRAGLRHSDL